MRFERSVGAHSSVFLESNLEPQLPELSQRFSIPAGVVHGIVRMLGDAILFPLRRLRRIFDKASIKIADPATGKSERVPTEETVKVVIDELPVERDVVGNKDSPALGVLFQPSGEGFHDRFGIIKSKVLFAGESTDGQRLGDEPIRDRLRPPVK